MLHITADQIPSLVDYIQPHAIISLGYTIVHHNPTEDTIMTRGDQIKDSGRGKGPYNRMHPRQRLQERRSTFEISVDKSLETHSWTATAEILISKNLLLDRESVKSFTIKCLDGKVLKDTANKGVLLAHRLLTEVPSHNTLERSELHRTHLFLTWAYYSTEVEFPVATQWIKHYWKEHRTPLPTEISQYMGELLRAYTREKAAHFHRTKARENH